MISMIIDYFCNDLHYNTSPLVCVMTYSINKVKYNSITFKHVHSVMIICDSITECNAVFSPEEGGKKGSGFGQALKYQNVCMKEYVMELNCRIKAITALVGKSVCDSGRDSV